MAAEKPTKPPAMPPKAAPKDKPKGDAAQRALNAVERAIGGKLVREPRLAVASPQPEAPKAKDPAAVELGRKGGLKGGKARSDSMTAEERAEAARKAAAARWKDHKKPS